MDAILFLQEASFCFRLNALVVIVVNAPGYGCGKTPHIIDSLSRIQETSHSSAA